MTALIRRLISKDTSSECKPFIDPLHPHLIRCPIPSNVGVSENTRIARLVNGVELNGGVWLNPKGRLGVLDSRELVESEWKDRVELVVQNGDKKLYLDYKVDSVKRAADSAIAVMKQLRQNIPLFEKSLQVDATQQIRIQLQQTYQVQLAGFVNLYESLLSASELNDSSPMKNQAADFSKLYDLDSKLSEKDYKFTVLIPDRNVEEPGLDLVGESFWVHGCVIEVNGGEIKHAFTSSMREDTQKEMKLPVSSPEVIKLLIQYLYGMPVVFKCDREAQELYHLASQYFMEPLRELCQHRKMKQDLEDLHPSKLPKLESFGFGGSVQEMLVAADQARVFFQRNYEACLKPHIDRLIQK